MASRDEMRRLLCNYSRETASHNLYYKCQFHEVKTRRNPEEKNAYIFFSSARTKAPHVNASGDHMVIRSHGRIPKKKYAWRLRVIHIQILLESARECPRTGHGRCPLDVSAWTRFSLSSPRQIPLPELSPEAQLSLWFVESTAAAFPAGKHADKRALPFVIQDAVIQKASNLSPTYNLFPTPPFALSQRHPAS